MTDLFTYPRAPGFKERGGTSEAAAHAMRGSCEILRDRVLVAISRHPMTADEAAGAVGESILSVRPRVTELSRLGKIERTGERRRNVSGQSAAVWRARRQGQPTNDAGLNKDDSRRDQRSGAPHAAGDRGSAVTNAERAADHAGSILQRT